MRIPLASCQLVHKLCREKMYDLVGDGVLQQAVVMKQKLTCIDYLISSLLIFNALRLFRVFYLMTQHTFNFIFHKIQPHSLEKIYYNLIPRQYLDYCNL